MVVVQFVHQSVSDVVVCMVNRVVMMAVLAIPVANRLHHVRSVVLLVHR